MNKKNNVCFREWKGEQDYIKILKRPHKGDDFCSSRIGMIVGKQYMYLNKNCFDYGEIIHTFFHAFGFLNENHHPDQEDYIQSQLKRMQKIFIQFSVFQFSNVKTGSSIQNQKSK